MEGGGGKPGEAVPDQGSPDAALIGRDGGRVTHTLHLSGMSCGSCEKLIERVAKSNGAMVETVDANSGLVRLSCPQEMLGTIKEELAKRGFRETDGAEERGDPARLFAYVRSVIAAEPHVELENRLLNYSLAAGAAILVGGGFFYGALLDALGTPLRAASMLLFVMIAAVLTAYSYAHMSAYRRWMSCTNGMMVGMTTGMASGFMIGGILGATNGMFVGSVGGMAVGISLGLALGRSCGIMGAMEGVMAGLMSGTMGAMTTVMMLNDHVIAFMYILSAVCAVIVGGLSYMMFREAGPAPREGYRGGFAVFAYLAIALSAMMVLIILLGPKSGIVLR